MVKAKIENAKQIYTIYLKNQNIVYKTCKLNTTFYLKDKRHLKKLGILLLYALLTKTHD